jgi:hypothetical protein
MTCTDAFGAERIQHLHRGLVQLLLLLLLLPPLLL